MSPEQTEAYRELFWQNVVREILTELATICAQRVPELPPPPTETVGKNTHDASSKSGADREGNGSDPAFDPSMFDGRMGVITATGQRIAISNVSCLFGAGSIKPRDRALALAVECSVFQIRTPDGHVFTLPLHHIRAFHSVSPELIERVQRSTTRRRARKSGEPPFPFGFAAFTSMARGLDASPLPEPAPLQPGE
jgi:hypothetical protein